MSTQSASETLQKNQTTAGKKLPAAMLNRPLTALTNSRAKKTLPGVFNVSSAMKDGHVETGTFVADKKSNRSFGKVLKLVAQEWTSGLKRAFGGTPSASAPLQSSVPKTGSPAQLVVATPQTSHEPQSAHVPRIRTYALDIAKIKKAGVPPVSQNQAPSAPSPQFHVSRSNRAIISESDSNVSQNTEGGAPSVPSTSNSGVTVVPLPIISESSQTTTPSIRESAVEKLTFEDIPLSSPVQNSQLQKSVSASLPPTPTDIAPAEIISTPLPPAPPAGTEKKIVRTGKNPIHVTERVWNVTPAPLIESHTEAPALAPVATQIPVQDTPVNTESEFVSPASDIETQDIIPSQVPSIQSTYEDVIAHEAPPQEDIVEEVFVEPSSPEPLPPFISEAPPPPPLPIPPDELFSPARDMETRRTELISTRPRATTFRVRTPSRMFEILAGVVGVSVIGIIAFIAYQFTSQESTLDVELPGRVTRDTPPPVPLTHFAPDQSIPLGIADTREAFSSALTTAMQNANAEITHLYPTHLTDEGEALVRTSELLALIAPSLNEKTVRSFGEKYMLGFISTTDVDEVFLIFTIDNFDTVFRELLKDEGALADDLSILNTQTIAENSVATFDDAIRANTSVRIERDSDGRELFVYGFVGKDTLVITPSSVAFSRIAQKIIAE